MTDGQLLTRFVESGDESAFEALVRRHGPMVLGVCGRTLRNRQDAEDAFQATFLVLARRAASVRPRERIVCWLYGVARRTAMKARGAAVRRSTRERQLAKLPEPAAEPPDGREGLTALIEQELDALSEKYRIAVVLCDLEGKTRREAARLLGCPEGTLSTRLMRARAALARRLVRRGVTPWDGAPATFPAALPALSTGLVLSTAKAAGLFAAGPATAAGLIPAKAVALAEGMLTTMFLSKLKSLGAVALALGLLGLGVGMWALPAPAATAPAAPGAEAPKTDEGRLQGEWQMVSCEGKDGKLADDLVRGDVLSIKDGVITVKNDTPGHRGEYELTFRLDESKDPKEIDETLVKPEKAEKPNRGIYKLEGDVLTCCFSDPGAKRPTEFSAKAGSGWTLTVCKRNSKE